MPKAKHARGKRRRGRSHVYDALMPDAQVPSHLEHRRDRPARRPGDRRPHQAAPARPWREALSGTTRPEPAGGPILYHPDTYRHYRHLHAVVSPILPSAVSGPGGVGFSLDVFLVGWIVGLVMWMVGLVWRLSWLCTRGTLRPNRYGPDPLAGIVGATPA